jgi:hypothetical protein
VIGPQSFLSYARFRWLKLSLLLVAGALAAYFALVPPRGRSGSTPVGYGLGILSALLMLWLMWFGVRKRRYGAGGAPLRGWLSAHVYLGTTLLLLVPLHSAFEFGWNVHTLAYAVMSAVIVSGFFGVGLYGFVPTPMTGNRPGEKLAALLQQIAEIDVQCRTLGRELPDFYTGAIRMAIDETRIGGGLRQQLAGTDSRCGTTRALGKVRDHNEHLEPKARDAVNQLVELLARKQALLGRVRRDGRYKALLDLWLVIHIPLAVASVALVAAHVFIVLYYGWVA